MKNYYFTYEILYKKGRINGKIVNATGEGNDVIKAESYEEALTIIKDKRKNTDKHNFYDFKVYLIEVL